MKYLAYLATANQSIQTWHYGHSDSPDTRHNLANLSIWQSSHLAVQTWQSMNLARQSSSPRQIFKSQDQFLLDIHREILDNQKATFVHQRFRLSVTTDTSQWTRTCSWFQLGGVTPSPDIKRNQYSMTVFIINILLLRICSNSEIIIFKILSIFGGTQFYET